MSSAVAPFDAWALPRTVRLPQAAPTERRVGSLTVRMLSADPFWLRATTRGVRAAGTGLRALPVREIAAVLGRVGERFLIGRDPLRVRALELLPATSGLSPAMAAAVLDGMASDWSAERLLMLLETDFLDPGVLDGFVESAQGSVAALGPRLCAQVVSGSVPGVGATALLRALLVKAPTVVKPGWGDVVLPVLFARGIAEEEPALADAVAVVYWPGGSDALEDVLLQEGDVVVAYGGDGPVRSLRDRAPVTTRFVAYHHRMSLGVVARDALTPTALRQAASDVAGAVAFFDQRGCVSPQVVFVERGGAVLPAAFATEVAKAMAALEASLPGGVLDAHEAAALQQARATAELLASSGAGATVDHGGTTAWTVLFDPDDAMEPACVGRLVRIVPVDDATEVPARVASRSAHLQTVGIAGLSGERLRRVAEAFADVGASRVAPFQDVPFPPPWWHHDGQGPLRALVRWVDLVD